MVDFIISRPHCPRYDENPKCSFGKDRMHFALHVRMGDRREFQDGNLEYFQLLELIMKTIAEEVVYMGLPKPLFHIFSETLAPCPSEETGLFDEFPTWPVSLDQVRKAQKQSHACRTETHVCLCLHEDEVPWRGRFYPLPG